MTRAQLVSQWGVTFEDSLLESEGLDLSWLDKSTFYTLYTFVWLTQILQIIIQRWKLASFL